MQNCITRITNGQETVKVFAHFCCNNSISGIESVKKEFIINLGTVYNKPLRYLLKTWIEFIQFRGFCVKKKDWLQWITGIFFSSLINNFYNILNECIDYNSLSMPGARRCRRSNNTYCNFSISFIITPYFNTFASKWK